MASQHDAWSRAAGEEGEGAARPVRTCHHKSKNGWTRIELKYGSLKMSQVLEGEACHPID